MKIPIAAIREQLELYVGWTYSLDDPRYPVPLPGLRLPPPPPRQTNCCAFVEGLIVGAARASIPDLEWGRAAHRRAMVWHAGDRFGPVEALVDAGLAVRRAECTDAPPPPWSVCQGWRGNRGHTFIVAATDGDKVLILEANSARGLNGVGWRAAGGLTSGRAPDGWQTVRDVWTWRRVMDAYPELAIAALCIDAADDPLGDLDELASLPEPFIPGEPEGGGSIRG